MEEGKNADFRGQSNGILRLVTTTQYNLLAYFDQFIQTQKPRKTFRVF